MCHQNWIIVVVLLLASNARTFAEDIKLPSSKGASNKIVAEIGNRDLKSLSNIEKTQLARAYNNLSNPVKAFEACDAIPEAWLAEHNLLGDKSTYLSWLRDEPGQKDVLLRELAFAQRCLDRNYGNRREWLMRKASVLCVAAVRFDIAPDGVRKPILHDAELLEHAFETLKAAKSTPRAVRPPQVSSDFEEGYLEDDFAGHFFPLLSEQDRYQQLIANKAQ